MAPSHPSSSGIPDESPKLFFIYLFLIYLYSIHPYAFSVYLIRLSIISLCALSVYLILLSIIGPYALSVYLILLSIIGPCASVAGRFLLETRLPLALPWQSPKQLGDMQKGRDFPDREQQEREDNGEGEPHLKEAGSTESAQNPYKILTFISQRVNMVASQLIARLSIFLSTLKRMVWEFTQLVSKSTTRSKSGRSIELKGFCKLAVMSALLQIPTGVAGHEPNRDDAVAGYGPIEFGAIFAMAALLFSSVGVSVQWHLKSLRNSVRRPSDMLSCYMVWVPGVLLAMGMVLAPACNDINHIEVADSIIPGL